MRRGAGVLAWERSESGEAVSMKGSKSVFIRCVLSGWSGAPRGPQSSGAGSGSLSLPLRLSEPKVSWVKYETHAALDCPVGPRCAQVRGS